MNLTDSNNSIVYNIFIFCSGKCGGTTLANTFFKNGYKTTHLHGFNCKGMFISDLNVENSKDILNNSCEYFENVYIIDSYRTPIERKISSFFQNIKLHLPNYTELTVDKIIEFFNDNLVNKIEEYHSINKVLEHYNIPLFTEFNFTKRYNMVKVDNKIFIKVLFKDINDWNIILSEIFGKDIVVHNRNLTKDKLINNLYEDFKKNYKVPKTYINDILRNDSEFMIYNTKEEQEKYIKKWLDKSF